MATAEPKLRLFNLDEYYRMAELGLFRGERVELIEGEVVQMSAQKSLHAVSIGLSESALRNAFGTGYWVRSQMPLHFGSRSGPEPDLAVVPGGPRDYSDHPTSALLVVEVSDTSLDYDRGPKARLYAGAGIADYWIVNLVDRQLEIRRSPGPAVAGRGFVFADTQFLSLADFAAPLAMPKARINVADLLP